MPVYVIEVKEIKGNRVSNDGETTSVHFTNQHADVLTYCAPRNGAYIRAVALEADDIDAAVKSGVKLLGGQPGGSTR